MHVLSSPVSNPGKVARLIGLAALAALTACSPDSAPVDGSSPVSYELPPARCTLQSNIQGPAGKTWTGCYLHYDAPSNVVTWTLMPPGTSGSGMSPGEGWIVLSFSGDAPENTTAKVSTIVSTRPAKVATDQVIFAYGTGGGNRSGGTGSIDVGSNIIDAQGLGGKLSGVLDLKLTDGQTLTGGFSASAASASQSAGSGSGGGTCGGSSSACNKETSSCEAGGQGPCYCAAACLCASACEPSCQQTNHANAAKLGYPCAW